MNWRILRDLFTRNWREKLLSLLLAVLFWFMIKAQVNRASYPYSLERLPRETRL